MYLQQAHRHLSDLKEVKATESLEVVEGKERRTAARLHVDIGDMPKLEGAYQRAASALEALDVEGRAYAEMTIKNKQVPDRERLLEFSERRAEILRQTRDDLRNALGETNWLKLQTYLDNEFRKHVKRRAISWTG